MTNVNIIKSSIDAYSERLHRNNLPLNHFINGVKYHLNNVGNKSIIKCRNIIPCKNALYYELTAHIAHFYHYSNIYEGLNLNNIYNYAK